VPDDVLRDIMRTAREVLKARGPRRFCQGLDTRPAPEPPRHARVMASPIRDRLNGRTRDTRAGCDLRHGSSKNKVSLPVGR